jgi:hypothetical protein
MSIEYLLSIEQRPWKLIEVLAGAAKECRKQYARCKFEGQAFELAAKPEGRSEAETREP